jgi:AcrR family transcriptional regulator
VSTIALRETRPQRTERQRQREASILAAAREELADKGYDGVTMEALAVRAGVVKKTLYNLHGSKDALLIAAISEIVHGYRDLPSDSEAGIPALIASRRAASRQIVATPAYAEAMFRALAQAEPGHVLVRLLLRDAVADAVVHLDAARVRGELLANVDVAELAERVVSQVWGLILLRQKGLVPLAEFESRSVRGLAAALLAASRGRRRQRLNGLLEETERPRPVERAR